MILYIENPKGIYKTIITANKGVQGSHIFSLALKGPPCHLAPAFPWHFPACLPFHCSSNLQTNHPVRQCLLSTFCTVLSSGLPLKSRNKSYI